MRNRASDNLLLPEANEDHISMHHCRDQDDYMTSAVSVLEYLFNNNKNPLNTVFGLITSLVVPFQGADSTSSVSLHQ